MRTALVIAICLMLCGVGAAAALDLPSYDRAVAHPQTVVDYFLLCPGLGVDSGGRLDPGSGAPAGRESFEKKKNLLRQGYSGTDFFVTSVTIDIPNAFIQIAGTVNGLEYSLTFVYFDRQGKGNVPAFSYYAEGGDGDTYATQFYDVDPANHWTDITQDVLPGVSLEELDTNPVDPPDVYPEVDWEYVLPQKGTTVRMVPHMTYQMSAAMAGTDLFELVKRLTRHWMDLKWDRVQGKFLRGGVK
jgi:hypothetical protein